MKYSNFTLIALIVGLTGIGALDKSDKKLLKTSDGNYLVKNNYVVNQNAKLTKADISALIALSSKGSSEVVVLPTSVTEKAVQESIITSKKAVVTNEIVNKVNRVLAKYNPKKFGDGNFRLAGVYVVQGPKLTESDFRTLEQLTHSADGTDVIHTEVSKNWVNETVLSSDLKVDPQLKSKVDQILSKYQ